MAPSASQPGCGRAWRLVQGLVPVITYSALRDAMNGVVSSGSAVRNERFKHAGRLNYKPAPELKIEASAGTLSTCT